MDPRQIAARRPRHAVDDRDHARIRLETKSPPNGVFESELADFSREGAKLKVAGTLADQSPVVLHITVAEAGWETRIAGRIAWKQPDGKGCLVGCIFDETVPYEVLGELMLHGVLER